MRLVIVILAIGLCCGTVAAQQDPASTSGSLRSEIVRPASPAQPPPGQGYVFGRPEIATSQLLWGIVHSVRLIGLACARNKNYAGAQAWLAWQEREEEQIRLLNETLGRYYFQDPAAPAHAINTALGLKPKIELLPDKVDDECNSLAETLTKPGYELARRRGAWLK